MLTSFEGGEAPDIIHDEASDLTDFAYGGYLADLTRLPAREDPRRDPGGQLGHRPPSNGGRVYGVPFLQEPQVIIANRKLLERSGVRIPTAGHPWTWDEFEEVSRELTHGKGQGGNGQGGKTRGGEGQDGKSARYGVVWTMKEPVKQSVNLSLSTGGQIFTKKRTDDGDKNAVRFGARTRPSAA